MWNCRNIGCREVKKWVEQLQARKQGLLKQVIRGVSVKEELEDVK